ncbi:MAG: class I tRNA ligase family protein, partial [Candidatus Pacebacteria bacterium]|nr:class I tRNA ligase family protein [Candidatus Paceibacterota bacterium]
TSEPFKKLRNVGLVLAFDGQKMSKSKGNVVSPDAVIDEYGADTLRIYEMFMGPFSQAIQWNDQGVKGVYRFLNKFWDILIESKNNEESSPLVEAYVDKLIKKVENDLEKMKFNTPIAFFMEFVDFVSNKKLGKKELEKILIIFSIFAPHFCEEIWGKEKSIMKEKWPEVNEELIKDKTVNIMIQVNGKLRDKIEIEADISKEEIIKKIQERENIKKWVEGKKIKDIIFIPKRLINIVLCAE